MHSGVISQDVALVAIGLVDRERTIAKFFDADSNLWRVDMFQHLLPAFVVAEILGMTPPSPHIGSDRVIWGLTSNGKFSSKSAYEAFGNELLLTTTTTLPWQRIWRWEGSFKISNFLWRVMHNGVWVNARRWRSGLARDHICRLCQEEDETTLHALRDWRCVKPLWEQLVLPSAQTRFFSNEIRTWLLHNLESNSLVSLGGGVIPNFGLLVWQVWVARANAVFQNVPFVLQQILSASLRMQLDHAHCRQALRNQPVQARKQYQEVMVRWSPPPLGWVKCNTDGSVRGSDRLAACGGVCRDSNGQWLLGFSHNSGSSNVLWAEL